MNNLFIILILLAAYYFYEKKKPVSRPLMVVDRVPPRQYRGDRVYIDNRVAAAAAAAAAASANVPSGPSSY